MVHGVHGLSLVLVVSLAVTEQRYGCARAQIQVPKTMEQIVPGLEWKQWNAMKVLVRVSFLIKWTMLIKCCVEYILITHLFTYFICILYIFSYLQVFTLTVSCRLSLPKGVLSLISLFTPGWLIRTTLAIQQ